MECSFINYADKFAGNMVHSSFVPVNMYKTEGSGALELTGKGLEWNETVEKKYRIVMMANELINQS